jgi:hypothetical protein
MGIIYFSLVLQIVHRRSDLQNGSLPWLASLFFGQKQQNSLWSNANFYNQFEVRVNGYLLCAFSQQRSTEVK